MAGIRISEHYTFMKKLCQSGCGTIYLGKDRKTAEEVIIKLERQDVKKPQLPNEATIFQQLDGCTGVPRMRCFGHTDIHSAIVMDKFDGDLYNTIMAGKKYLSLRTVLDIGIQLLEIIEEMHERNVLHRDIKPENILVKDGELYLADFGLSAVYRDEKGQRIPCPPKQATTKYASIGAHTYSNSCPRDDLVSIGYLLIDLLKGRLPWNHVKGNQNERFHNVGRIKKQTSIKDLCAELPREFSNYMNYIYKCKTGHIDYGYLRNQFQGHLDFMTRNYPSDIDIDYGLEDDERSQ